MTTLRSTADKSINTVSSVSADLRTELTSKSTKISTLVKNLYSLTLWDTQTGTILESSVPLSIGGSSSSKDNFTPEFMFRVAPRSIEMKEPFASTITATQDYGKYVESQGSIFKDIRITGTTGLRPHKDDPRVINLFGVNLSRSASLLGAGTISDAATTTPSSGLTGIDPLDRLANIAGPANTLPAGEVTGYDDIIFLTNLFRLYSDIENSDELAGRVVMLWRNKVDGEYWVVQPTDFNISKNSKSPLTYEYNIGLKTLAPFDFTVTIPADPLERLNSARRFVSRVNRYTQDITKTFLLISTKIDKFAVIPYDVTSFVLGPMVAVIEGLGAVSAATKRSVVTVKRDATQLRDNLRTVIDDFTGIFTEQGPERKAIIDAYRTACRIVSDPGFKDPVHLDFADAKENLTKAYSQTNNTGTGVALPVSGGGKTFIGNQPDAVNVRQTTIKLGETIRDVAGRVLGDRSQWHVLAVLNGLSAPYIAAVSYTGVLQPGDTILYPGGAGQGGGVSSVNITEDETANANAYSQGAIQQAFGRDIRLVSEPGGSSSILVDIQPNQSGDISTVMGVPNITQALKIKFATQRGELPVHPYFGAKFPIGTKATTDSLVGFRAEAEATLRSDPRVASINNLEIVAYADLLLVKASVTLKDSSTALNIDLPLRRF